MEVEAFPIGFTKGIRSHWRRRKYQRLENGDGGTRTKATQRLGGGARRGSSSGGWRVRLRGIILRRVRVVRAVVAAPGRLLCRLRDAYVGGMLTVARKAACSALPGDGAWAKRAPRRRHQQKLLLLPGAPQAPSEFEKRLVMEIYKSIVASKELTAMLHSSTAHIPSRREHGIVVDLAI